LPQDLATPGQYFFAVQALATKRVVGYLWYAVRKGRAFLFDIVIQPSARGQGYGRQAMECLEAHARQRGLEAVELHVFGHNEVAQKLYANLGYGVTDLSMRKWLGSGNAQKRKSG
jgi:ribosomal protein S18 acetylase RimI-like enzyme